MTDSKLIIVGIGPYSWYSHLLQLRSWNVIPKLVVELESKAAHARVTLDTFGFNDTELLLVPDEDQDNLELTNSVMNTLNQKISQYQITDAILSCEPKARYAYLKFFINEKINCFCDKPLVAIKNCTRDPGQARKISSMQNEILALAEQNNVRIDLNVKRRVNPKYQKIAEEIKSISANLGIPITSLEIYSSGGKWLNPGEVQLDNHPFRHGYGHLYHSGFHFVDLLAFFMEQTKMDYDRVEIQTHAIYFGDIFEAINSDKLSNIFKRDISPFTANATVWGELDLNTRICFKKNGHTITVALLNLMTSGFSRRHTPERHFNTYGKVGRVKHEHQNIHLGPFANIQLHEYQVKKEIDLHRKVDEALNEILFFRNPELIGGKEFQRLTAVDWGPTNQSPLKLFLKKEASPVDLKNLKLSLDLFAFVSESLAQQGQTISRELNKS